MLKKVRQGCFETNSSSIHTITIMTRSDYDRWANDSNLYIVVNCGLVKAKQGQVYTSEEVKKMIQDELNKSIEKDIQFYGSEEGMYAGYGFVNINTSCSDQLEQYFKSYTLPSGEEVVAFGEYGFDY